MEYHNHKFSPINWSKVKGHLWPRNYISSDILRASADSTVSKSSSGTYTVKEIKVFRYGTIRVTFECNVQFSCSASFGGSSRGTTGTSSYTNFDDPPAASGWIPLDFEANVNPGDILYISLNIFDTGYTSYVRNFRLYWDYEIDKKFYEIVIN